MKINNEVHSGKSGGVLLMAMLVMLAFSILAVGLFRMSTTNAVETVYQDHSSQAFWIAETGLQDAIQRLAYNDTFRNLAAGGATVFSVTNAATKTAYNVTVRDSGEGNSIIEHYEFDVESIGWKNSMNRRLQQRVRTRPGFISAIMAPNNIDIAANTIVSGPIMVLENGVLTIDDKIPPGQNDEGDYDLIVLDDGASINGKASQASEGKDYGVLDLPVPDSLPDMPDYSGYKTYASTNGMTNAPLLELNLGGKVNYFNIPGGITVNKLTGSGTIVNTGDITINGALNSGSDVESDIAVLSFGNVSIGQKTDFDGNTLIYAFDKVYYGDGSYMAGNSAILADGGTAGAGIAQDMDDIIMGGQSEFYGIVFADEGNVVIQAGSGGDENTRIVGTLISGNSVEMNSNSEIIFDPSVFYSGTLLDLTTFWSTDVITTKNVWEELPPL